jgi:hypothetical protein
LGWLTNKERTSNPSARGKQLAVSDSALGASAQSREHYSFWLYLGETRGRGRMDQHHEAHGRAVKRIYVYPLCRNVQHRLAQDAAPRLIPWEKA